MGAKVKKKKAVRYFDYSLLAVIVFLMCFGMVMLFSTSAYNALVTFGDSMHFLKRQMIWSVLGIAMLIAVSRIDYHRYAKYSKIVFILSMFLMMLVRFSPLGVKAGGAKRWLLIPIIKQQFQPSELMKIAVILFIPALICRMGKNVRKLQSMIQIFILGLIAFGGVRYFTDNLSTALIVLGIVGIIIFIIHPKTAPFLILGTVGMAGLLIGVRILGKIAATSDDFRMRRILAWLNPEQYASGDSFQVMQGLYAIGSGGFFGKGLGNSAQKMVIPEVQNDMILSIICEELGVFGAIIVLVLFGMLLYRLLFIAQNAPDLYGSLMVTGIFAHIALQVLLNVAVVTTLIPTTGITLPFISYGGTSVVFLMIELGIALSVSRKIKIEDV